MRIALIDTAARSQNSRALYPIGLLKIGAYQKSLGNEVELFKNRLPGPGEFEEIWISTLFTYDLPRTLGMTEEAMNRAKKVVVGGIASSLIPKPFRFLGAEVIRGIFEPAEYMVGDYSLVGESPRYSIVHTSRGCVRKCGFCAVSLIEPEFRDNPQWAAQVVPGTRKVFFYDNNWLAKPIEYLRRDVQIMRQLTGPGKIRSWDFNQALDARLMTEEKADLLEGLPIQPMRFAFDWKGEDGYYQDAVRMMARRGCKEFISYILYNFKDDPADLYYRLKESVKLTEELGVQVKSFPMKYQPILEVDKRREYVGPYWTLTRLSSFRRIIAAHSVSGQISCLGGSGMSPIEEFEFWFGENAEEFVRIITFTNIRTLIKRKKALLRHQRLGIRDNDKKENGDNGNRGESEPSPTGGREAERTPSGAAA